MSFDLKILQGDLKISPQGDLQKVEDNEKLIQDISKMAVTPVNGNPFHPWYGSHLNKSLIGNVFDFNMTSSLASNQLRRSMETLQNLQKNQIKLGQIVTPGEILSAIRSIKIERNQVDPRYFSVSIDVLTKALNAVTTTLTIDPL